MGTFRLPAVCVIGMSLLSIGCGGGNPADSGPTRYALTGQVTLDGMPLESGTISFLPPSEMDSLRVAGGPITNGTFSVPREKGANEGTYRVEIRSLKPSGKKVPDPDMGGMIDVMVEAVPPRFNDKSELKAEVGPGKTEFDFVLISK